jgi:hypothetical protein
MVPGAGDERLVDAADDPMLSEEQELRAAQLNAASRRSVLKVAALSLAAPMINRGRFSLFAQSETEYSARTVDLVRRSTVIDSWVC